MTAPATAGLCFPHNLCFPLTERNQSMLRKIITTPPHQLATLLDKAPPQQTPTHGLIEE
jgi:hypothetical protein